jgi:MFS family permease
MKACPRCGREYEDNWQVCDCGYVFEPPEQPVRLPPGRPSVCPLCRRLTEGPRPAQCECGLNAETLTVTVTPRRRRGLDDWRAGASVYALITLVFAVAATVIPLGAGSRVATSPLWGPAWLFLALGLGALAEGWFEKRTEGRHAQESAVQVALADHLAHRDARFLWRSLAYAVTGAAALATAYLAHLPAIQPPLYGFAWGILLGGVIGAVVSAAWTLTAPGRAARIAAKLQHDH